MTTATGSPVLWQLAEAFDVVPQPPNQRLARLLASWWTTPRRFGCRSAKGLGAAWFVVCPDLRIWCAECAAERFGREARCAYCGADVPADGGVSLIFEMRSVHVLGRACLGCHNDERE